MPTYDYECKTCESKLEIFQKITALPLKMCPACGNEDLKRLPGRGAGLCFKGTGFYSTDYGTKKRDEISSTSKKTSEACPCENKNSCS